MQKKKIIGLGVFASIVCGLGFLTLPKRVASADVGATIKDFQMEYGASVRIGEKDGKDGIRFTATLPTSVYESLEKLETDNVSVAYGMLIIPADYTQESSKTYTAPLSKETLFGENAKYTRADCTPNIGDNTCTCQKRHISYVESQTLTGTSDTKFLRGSLVDLKEGNRMRAFVGLGYIEYKANGISEYFLAENAKNKDGTGEANIENNTRSMSYVAQLAIADGKDDTSNTLYTQYVQPFEDKSYKYEVHHYLPDQSEAIVQTLYAPLGEEVTAKHIAETEEYAQYSVYTLDKENENAHMQDIVYANGKTVLRCYYTKETRRIVREFDFKTQADAEKYLLEKSWYNFTKSTVSHMEEKDERQGIAVYKTNITKNGKYGAHFYIDLSEYVEEILDAFADDELTFSMQIDMLITTHLTPLEKQVRLRNDYKVIVKTGVWQTVLLDEQILKQNLANREEIEKWFKGQDYLFYIEGDELKLKDEVTYYIDCITYTITAE